MVNTFTHYTTLSHSLGLYSDTLLTHPLIYITHLFVFIICSLISSFHSYHLSTLIIISPLLSPHPYHYISPVFRQQSSKKLAMVVMDTQKEKERRLNQYATVCQQNQRFRLLLKVMCHVQLSYALRQLQVCPNNTIITT